MLSVQKPLPVPPISVFGWVLHGVVISCSWSEFLCRWLLNWSLRVLLMVGQSSPPGWRSVRIFNGFSGRARVAWTAVVVSSVPVVAHLVVSITEWGQSAALGSILCRRGFPAAGQRAPVPLPIGQWYFPSAQGITLPLLQTLHSLHNEHINMVDGWLFLYMLHLLLKLWSCSKMWCTVLTKWNWKKKRNQHVQYISCI